MKKKRSYKKRRAFPWQQGELKQLIDYFIKPMLGHKPKGMGIRHFLDAVFCVSDRDISVYKVVKRFGFKGRDITIPLKPVNGVKSGFIYPGSLVWVRTDKTYDDRIDVEVFGGKGSKSRVYQFNEYDYVRRVKPFISKKPIELKQKEQRYFLNGQWVLQKYLLSSE